MCQAGGEKKTLFICRQRMSQSVWMAAHEVNSNKKKIFPWSEAEGKSFCTHLLWRRALVMIPPINTREPQVNIRHLRHVSPVRQLLETVATRRRKLLHSHTFLKEAFSCTQLSTTFCAPAISQDRSGVPFQNNHMKRTHARTHSLTHALNKSY